MRNTLYAVLTGIVCLGIVLGCEIPQSVTIKGSPDLYLNLGSPFGKDNTLLEVLNGDGVANRLGEGGGRTYTYTGDAAAKTDVKTYLLSFSLIEKNTPTGPGTIPAVPGEIPNLALHEIADFLGGVQFKEVPAYLYITGISPGTISFYSEIAGKKTYKLENKSLGPSATFEDDSDPTVEIWDKDIASPSPSHSFYLTDEFNAKSNVNLGYTITGSVTKDIPVKADLVILLPLRFTPPPDAETVHTEEGDFVKLNLDSLPKEDTDLFGRTNGGGGDDLFSQLDSVKIDIKPVDNNSIDNLYLGMIRKSGTHNALSLDNGNDPEPEEFLNEELAWPFNPIRLLMKKSVEDLIVKPTTKGGATFNFKIAVNAKTKLNIKL